MLWEFDGEILGFCIVVLIVGDLFRLRTHIFSSNDHAFIRFALVSALFMVIGILREIFPSVAIIKVLRLISFPAMLYMWFLYTLTCLRLKRDHFRRSATIVGAPVLVFAILTFSEIQNEPIIRNDGAGKFLGGSALAYLITICLLLCFLSILSIFLHANSIQRRKAVSLVIPPLIFVGTFVLYLRINEPKVINYSIVVMILFTYIIIQNRFSTYDPRNGVVNHHFFKSALKWTFAKPSKGCLVLIEVANFQYLINKYGHVAGAQLALSLGECFMAAVVKHLVFCLERNQFALLLRNVSLSEAQTIANCILEKFTSPWHFGKLNAVIDLHIGIVQYPSQASSSVEVLSAMNFLHAEIQVGGHGGPLTYSKDLMLQHQRKLEVLEAVRRSLYDASMVLQYQPIFDTMTGKIVSAEVLLRLQDPLMGLIMPNEFIPIAEETGLIIDLTYRIIKTACQFWNSLEPLGINLESLSINLSMKSFFDPEFCDRVVSILAEQGVESRYIHFELTESISTDSFETVKPVMEALVKEGFQFHMDDYGKGYSSMEYLLHLPFSTVKFDRSIILHGEKHFEILQALVFMMHKMGRLIVAEGVETEEQFALVRKAGINRTQGFLLSRPVYPRVLVQLVLTNHRKADGLPKHMRHERPISINEISPAALVL